MPKTRTFTVNNAGDPEPVTAQVPCRRITIGEDPSVAAWPTTAFKVRAPSMTDQARQKDAGQEYVFEAIGGNRNFLAGQIVGYVETVAGSTTFFQFEES